MEYSVKKMEDAWDSPKGYHLTGVIATSYSDIDKPVLEKLLRSSGSSVRIDIRNIYLFECSPKKHNDNNTKLDAILASRVFKPLCPLSCGDKNYDNLSCIECTRNNPPKKCFHPKVWFLRFSSINNENEVAWRIVISSRNMAKESATFIDTYTVVKGITGDKEDDRFDRLLEDLTVAHDASANNAFSSLEQFKKEIRNLEYKDEPPFYVFYDNGKKDCSDLLKILRIFSEIHILTPFVNTRFLLLLTKDNKILEKLTYYIPGITACNFRARCDEIENGINDIEGKLEIRTNNDGEDDTRWHAKVFLCKKRNGNEEKYYYIGGSHNATSSAIEKNSECSIGFEITKVDYCRMLTLIQTQFPFMAKSLEGELKEEEDPRPATEEYEVPEQLREDEIIVLNEVEKKELRECAIKQFKKELIKEVDVNANPWFADRSHEDKEQLYQYMKKMDAGIIIRYIKEQTSIQDIIGEVENQYKEVKADLLWKAYKDSCI